MMDTGDQIPDRDPSPPSRILCGVRPSFATILLLAAVLLGPPALVLSAISAVAPADLTLVAGPEPETLDPAIAARVVDLRLVSALVEPLTALDPATLEARPAAAATWTADALGTTFTLAPGLRFSNGDPLTAEDFVRSWRRVADPRTGAPMQAEALAVSLAARAEDDRTIRIEASPPRPDLLPLLSLPAFAPVHATAVAAHGERWTRPEHWVGSGPYRLAAWEPGRRIRFERNPFWRGAASVALASIEAMTSSGGAGEAQAAFRAYETGAADLAWSVPARAATALRAAGRTDLRERPGAGTYLLRFNTTRAILADPRVRRALSAAIDRRAICEKVLRGGEEPASTLVPEAFSPRPGASAPRPGPAWDPDRNSRPDPALDAAAAKEALTGKMLEMLYPASDDAAGIVGEVLQEAWRAAFGLSLRLRPSEPKSAFAAVKRLEYDIAWGSWIADYPDAGSVLSIFRSGSGNNRTGWRDDAFDATLRGADVKSGWERDLQLMYAEDRLELEVPFAPLHRTRALALVRPGLEGADALPFAHTLPWARLRWTPGAGPAAGRAPVRPEGKAPS